MNISIQYEGELDELILLHPTFSSLKHSEIAKTDKRSWSRRGEALTYDIQTMFIGKTGYGKSTTVNKFFGSSIMQTSDIESCTRSAQSFEFKISDEHYFSFGDLPGIGENQQRDEEYLSLYSKLINKTDVVIYVLRADMRDFSIDEEVCNKLFSQYEKKNVIFAVNFCDKVEPINRSLPFKPTPDQQVNIDKKVSLVKEIFNSVNAVIPYSAETGWNIRLLGEEIINVISNSSEINIQKTY